MALKKGQKKGRDERTQVDYLTSVKIHSRCRVVFLRSFTSSLFVYFFQGHPEMKFRETFSSVFFRNFLNHLPNRRRTHLLCSRRTLSAQGKNAFYASDKCSNFSSPPTQLLATFKQNLFWDDCYSQVLTFENRR